VYFFLVVACLVAAGVCLSVAWKDLSLEYLIMCRVQDSFVSYVQLLSIQRPVIIWEMLIIVI